MKDHSLKKINSNKALKPVNLLSENNSLIKCFPKTKDISLLTKKFNKNCYLLEFEECFVLIRSDNQNL
jgi:hypothetical protein